MNAPVQEAGYERPESVLRKEKSSPAVVQGIQGHLVKQLVSASGQGCAAVVQAGNSTGHESAQSRSAVIWRTRSVRSKTESYCMLHLKNASQRGVTVQVGNRCTAPITRSALNKHDACEPS